MTVRGLAAKTQELFGEKNGVNAASISRIEMGHNRPFLSTLGKLAAALEVDLAELVELADTKTVARPVPMSAPVMDPTPAPAPAPASPANVDRPVIEQPVRKKAKQAKTINDIAGQIPTGSVELKLYQGKGAGVIGEL